MNIGKALTELRKSKGLSRQNIADEFGISVHTYIKYENESVKPPYETLVKLADFYGVTTDYLLGREEQPNPLSLLKYRHDEDKFIEIYQQLPQIEKEVLADVISRLAQAQEEPKKKRVVERLGDIEDTQAKNADETSSA